MYVHTYACHAIPFGISFLNIWTLEVPKLLQYSLSLFSLIEKKKKDRASNIGTGVLHIPNFLQPVTFMTDISLRWKSILWALCHAWSREECVIMLGGRELCYFKLHIYFEFSSGPAKVLFCVMFSWRFCVWTLYIIAFLEGIVFFLKVSYCTVLYTNMCFIP